MIAQLALRVEEAFADPAGRMVGNGWWRDFTENLHVALPQPSRAHEVEGGQRLLNLVPAPTWECGRRTARVWEAGYALSPATENWARHVREAHRTRPALAVGFVGATSAGKSWLVSKLQSDGAAQPARLEQSFVGGVDLQSMTSDINLYMDPVDHLYYVDFEGCQPRGGE
eukprot:g24853.t1